MFCQDGLKTLKSKKCQVIKSDNLSYFPLRYKCFFHRCGSFFLCLYRFVKTFTVLRTFQVKKQKDKNAKKKKSETRTFQKLVHRKHIITKHWQILNLFNEYSLFQENKRGITSEQKVFLLFVFLLNEILGLENSKQIQDYWNESFL